MVYELTETDVSVIKRSLKAHLNQCKDFLKLDDKVKTFSQEERVAIEDKMQTIEKLLKNM